MATSEKTQEISLTKVRTSPAGAREQPAAAAGPAFCVELVALRLQAAQVVLPVTRQDLQLLDFGTVIALQALAHGAPHGAPAPAARLAVP